MVWPQLFFLLDATRRTIGWPIAILAIAFLFYALLGNYFPGEAGHRGYSLQRVMSHLYLGGSGIFGTPLGVTATFVILIVLFGAVLENSGAGKVLMDIANALTGKSRGGPAKAAVVGSSLMGMISGTAVANVLTTGTISIPLMKRTGYRPETAGAIEAVASTGGQLMPPVMGVAAFILSAMTVVPYREVIIAAALPAIAYFGCLFLSVVFQSRKQNITPVGKITEEMILTGEDYKNLIMIFAPILLILFMLITPKEAVGCGVLGSLFGVNQVIENGVCRAYELPWLFQLFQNSAGDAGSAGWVGNSIAYGFIFLR